MEDTTTTLDTPVTTSETSTAAPAISEPSAPVVTSERPASMLEALQQAAAKSEAATATTETAATGQPVPTDSLGAKGEPPQEKWPTILENARTKASTEAVAKLEAELGWARHVPRESLDHMSGIAREMSADPPAFAERFIGELLTNPQYAPQMRSLAARILGGRSSAPDLTPDVQIVDGAGQVTGQTFSADRVRAIVQDAVAQAIGKEVAPLKEAHQRQTAEASARAETVRVESAADAILADASTWEGFTELQPAIAAVLQAHPNWTVERAYVDAYSREYRPKLDQQAEQRVISNNHKKAAGNTAPGTGAAATPGKPRSREELRRHMESLAVRTQGH